MEQIKALGLFLQKKEIEQLNLMFILHGTRESAINVVVTYLSWLADDEHSVLIFFQETMVLYLCNVR